ncbi:MAG: L,D-transpeptidase YcbB [Sphingomonadales bacterium]|jgi:murein L,D-transpeptidase YcbB/YkuD|nr:L,D-transpeptidase YcbB [Sphingomonadales bacterium]
MKIRMLAGAACAVLMTPSVSLAAATSPEVPSAALFDPAADQAVSAFYASRAGAPLWLKSGADSSAARELIGVLQRASLDGLPSGPVFAGQAQTLLARAEAGDAAALASADRTLSTAWVHYVEALQTPPAGMTYADPWVAPRRDSAAAILARAAAAPSLAAYVRTVSTVNPIYAQLRDSAWVAMQANGGTLDPRVVASLDRARDIPPQGRFVMVDTGGARLFMIEDGRVVDSMKVIVGKADPATQTPMLASTIYYATLNPYWHVSGEMVRSLIARNVLDQGLGYLKSRGYQVMAADGSDELLDPAKVDWRAVAAGRDLVKVRQLPGPLNSMGRIKIGFPNASDIYLHDTPNKDLFAQDDRTLSHGCIRLEDATRLGRWLMGRDPQAASRDPEQNVLLPSPVPIYVTYLTAQVAGGQLSFVDDLYGRDGQRPSVVAALH